MPNLTERRHEQTRAEIADVAVALFLQRGFADTTMDDVAEAAGVSRRTAYRHFPSKDDLVFEQPRRWLVHFDQEIATPRADEDRREMCRRGLLRGEPAHPGQRRADRPRLPGVGRDAVAPRLQRSHRGRVV